MNITSDFKFDKPAEKSTSGSYEWWYFDAADDTGNWHIVVIFYDGCPFSTRYNKKLASGSKSALAKNHPAISISLYYRCEPVFYSMSEYSADQASFISSEKPVIDIDVGNNSLRLSKAGELLHHTLKLDEKLPCGDSIKGTITFSSEAVSDKLFGISGNPADGHGWNLTQPRAKVKCELILHSMVRGKQLIDWSGVGYHDHNLGKEPMKNEFKDWYWGRFHFPEHTLIFYLMNTGKAHDYKAWLLNRNGGLRCILTDGDLSTFMSNMFMLSSARTINLNNRNKEKVMIQQSHVLDSGPFYYRFRSDAILHLPDEDILEQGSGITEYIRPARIHSSIFWPLVHMRYRYADNPHWVQKSPKLYRWTW